MEQKMYTLEVFDGNEWEQVAEWFDSVEEAGLYYRNQLSGFVDMRITEEVE
jgi:hypothetical protein